MNNLSRLFRISEHQSILIVNESHPEIRETYLKELEVIHQQIEKQLKELSSD